VGDYKVTKYYGISGYVLDDSTATFDYIAGLFVHSQPLPRPTKALNCSKPQLSRQAFPQ
jgi:hypothetical protein